MSCNPSPTTRSSAAPIAGIFFRLTVAVLLFCGTDGNSELCGQQPPDIIFIVSDDHRPDSTSGTGGAVSTPNIDRLMNQGFRFNNTYNMGSKSPAVCSPSRAMFLSGRNVGTTWNTDSSVVGVDTMPVVFGASGYTTFGTGKWHLGDDTFRDTFDIGRHVLISGCIGCSNTSNHQNTAAQQLSYTVRLKNLDSGSYTSVYQNGVHVSERFGNAAVEYLSAPSTGVPRFCYVSFTAPHDPRGSPEPFHSMYRDAKGVSTVTLPPNFSSTTAFDKSAFDGEIRDEVLLENIGGNTPENVREELADYYGMITHMDVQIGNILDEALRAEGLDPAVNSLSDLTNTLIVFTSDHGLALGSHGLIGKQNPYEHSIKAVPLTFAGGVNSSSIQPGSSEALVYLSDIFPTMLELADIPAPKSVTSESLAGIIDGSQNSVRDSIYNAYRDLSRVCRQGDWKLIYYPGLHRVQLFNVVDDPYEMNDLSADPTQWARMETLGAEMRRLEFELNEPAIGLIPDVLFEGISPIYWESARNSTSSADITIDPNDVVLAINGGTTFSIDVGEFTFERQPSGSKFTGALNGATTGDSEYDGLLNTFGYGSSSFPITIDGLVPGQLYRAQVWYTDLRNGSDDRSMDFDQRGRPAVAGEPAPPGIVNVIGNLPGPDDNFYGQFSIGTFQAASTTETICADPVNGQHPHFNAVLVSVVPPGPVEIVATSLFVNEGILVEGDANSLKTSNDVRLFVQKDVDLPGSFVEFDLRASSPFDAPTAISFSVESSVSARTNVRITQKISLFNYDTDSYEEIYSGRASRFQDGFNQLDITGDPSRFVQPGTGAMEARIRFVGTLANSKFGTRTDHVFWTVTE